MAAITYPLVYVQVEEVVTDSPPVSSPNHAPPPPNMFNILLKDVLSGHTSHSSLSAPETELPSLIPKISLPAAQDTGQPGHPAV